MVPEHSKQILKFLSDKQIAKRYGVSRATVWRWLRAGKFPKSIKINGSTRWRITDLEQWEAEQEGVA